MILFANAGWVSAICTWSPFSAIGAGTSSITVEARLLLLVESSGGASVAPLPSDDVSVGRFLQCIESQSTLGPVKRALTLLLPPWALLRWSAQEFHGDGSHPDSICNVWMGSQYVVQQHMPDVRDNLLPIADRFKLVLEFSADAGIKLGSWDKF